MKKDVEPNMKSSPLTKSSLKIHKAFGVQSEETTPAQGGRTTEISIEDVEKWIAEESS